MRNVLQGHKRDGVFEKITWAAFHSTSQNLNQQIISATLLLPLFQENAHSLAMIKHSMRVIQNAIDHLNPGQMTAVAFDQPLISQIQCKWPETHGEDKLIVLFGGLHIEMAALKTLRHWLNGSG